MRGRSRVPRCRTPIEEYVRDENEDERVLESERCRHIFEYDRVWETMSVKPERVVPIITKANHSTNDRPSALQDQRDMGLHEKESSARVVVSATV